MTIEFKEPLRPGGAICVTMVAELPVAEISRNGNNYEVHFHPIADKLTSEEFELLKEQSRAEALRMTTLARITERLTS